MQDRALLDAMNAILTNGLGQMRPYLQGAMTLFITVCGFLVLFNEMSARRATSYTIRAVVIAYVMSGVGAYNQWVTNLFFTKIPNTIATIVTGASTPITAAQQFDQLSQAAENVIATAMGQATGITMIGDKIALWWALGLIHVILSIEFFVFMLGRKLMAIVIVMGMFLIFFELFENTRGYFRSWAGKLVGLAAFQLASTSMLSIDSQGAFSFVQAISANPGASLDLQIANIDHLSAWFLGDALSILAVPSIAAIGSGVAAGTAVGASFALGAGRIATRLGATSARAGVNSAVRGIAAGIRKLRT